MEVIVIGAGVVGVTTAWALQKRGHSVTVVERLDGPALETSRGNAGQRSFGHVSPWASPKLIRKALPTLFRREGPLKLRIPPSLITLHFLTAMTRQALTPGLFKRNHEAMLQLACYSRDRFQEWDQALELPFDDQYGSLLKLASDDVQVREYRELMPLLDRVGIENEWLDPDGVRAREPGLDSQTPLQGGLLLPGDGSGDSHLFSTRLAERAEQAGVRFRYDTEVTHLKTAQQRLDGIQIRDEHGASWLQADAYVVCAGCASRDLGLSLGLKWPIYPVKGYSLTAPIRDPEHAPQAALIEDRYQIAITRLGDRLRATGFAELAEFNRSIRERRLASIRDGLDSRFPGAVDWAEAEAWTGFRPMTPDGPALLGPTLHDNVFANSGHGTWGWTLSVGSAEWIAAYMDGEKPPVPMTAFDPRRFSRKRGFRS